MSAKDVKAQQERCGRHGGDLRGVRRPTMRLVQVNSVEQQGRLMQHRTAIFCYGNGAPGDQWVAGAFGRNLGL